VNSDGRKRRSEEWDQREKEWTDEMKRQSLRGSERLKSKRLVSKTKKFNPKRRFRLMLLCTSIFVLSVFVLWLTVSDVNATYQTMISMISTIVSGVIVVVNYGKDILVTILNATTKSSLR